VERDLAAVAPISRGVLNRNCTAEFDSGDLDLSARNHGLQSLGESPVTIARGVLIPEGSWGESAARTVHQLSGGQSRADRIEPAMSAIANCWSTYDEHRFTST
jgi:hypothetical protein